MLSAYNSRVIKAKIYIFKFPRLQTTLEGVKHGDTEISQMKLVCLFFNFKLDLFFMWELQLH